MQEEAIDKYRNILVETQKLWKNKVRSYLHREKMHVPN